MAVDGEWIKDLFAAFGPIAVKRMFSGIGIFADGLMFGMAFGETIYLFTDENSRGAFEAEGAKAFSYAKPSAGKTVSTRYYALPERLYDDGDELAVWARLAHAAALAKKAKGGAMRRGPVKRRRA